MDAERDGAEAVNIQQQLKERQLLLEDLQDKLMQEHRIQKEEQAELDEEQRRLQAIRDAEQAVARAAKEKAAKEMRAARKARRTERSEQRRRAEQARRDADAARMAEKRAARAELQALHDLDSQRALLALGVPVSPALAVRQLATGGTSFKAPPRPKFDADNGRTPSRGRTPRTKDGARRRNWLATSSGPVAHVSETETKDEQPSADKRAMPLATLGTYGTGGGYAAENEEQRENLSGLTEDEKELVRKQRLKTQRAELQSELGAMLAGQKDEAEEAAQMAKLAEEEATRQEERVRQAERQLKREKEEARLAQLQAAKEQAEAIEAKELAAQQQCEAENALEKFKREVLLRNSVVLNSELFYCFLLLWHHRKIESTRRMRITNASWRKCSLQSRRLM